MIVADASFIYALLDSRDRNHEQAAAWYSSNREDLATTPMIIAEVDHLALRIGDRARQAFRKDLVAGAYKVEWSAGTAGTVSLIAQTYRELGVSLADASLVWLAGHLETERVATFDERHFRVMKPQGGRRDAFILLPADA